MIRRDAFDALATLSVDVGHFDFARPQLRLRAPASAADPKPHAMRAPLEVYDYRDDDDVDLEALAALRAACEFAAKGPDVLAAQIAGARWVVQAREDGRLVGFG